MTLRCLAKQVAWSFTTSEMPQHCYLVIVSTDDHHQLGFLKDTSNFNFKLLTEKNISPLTISKK